MPPRTLSKSRTQRLFRNGGSQAVRIPKDMNFKTDEVILHRDGDRLIIEPKAEKLSALSKQMGKPLDWNWEASDEPVQPEKLF